MRCWLYDKDYDNHFLLVRRELSEQDKITENWFLSLNCTFSRRLQRQLRASGLSEKHHYLILFVHMQKLIMHSSIIKV